MPTALLDTNVLVHAVYRGSPLYESAVALVHRALTERGRYCSGPQNILEFAAGITRAKLVDPPVSSAEAARMAGVLYRSRKLAKLYPSRGTIMTAAREGAALGITGPQWYDLFLAVTMREA